MEAIKTKIGSIAICTEGYVGLILKEKDGLYQGIHLGRLKLGKKWESKTPKVIGNIHEFVVKAQAKEYANSLGAD